MRHTDWRAPYGYTATGECVRYALGFVVCNGPTWSADGRTMFGNDTVAASNFASDFGPETTGAVSNQKLCDTASVPPMACLTA